MGKSKTPKKLVLKNEYYHNESQGSCWKLEVPSSNLPRPYIDEEDHFVAHTEYGQVLLFRCGDSNVLYDFDPKEYHLMGNRSKRDLFLGLARKVL